MLTFKEFMCLVVIAVGVLWIHNAEADDWGDEDTAREIVYQVLHVMDYKQTKYISRHCDLYTELNPILGTCPDSGEVDRYFLLMGLAHYGISKWLSHKHRGTWQNVTVIVQVNVVVRNASIGMKMEW